MVEGIQNQEIPLLQTYVLSRFSRDASLLSNVIRLGLEEALALLCEREWKYATKMLQNMVGTNSDKESVVIVTW